MSFLASIPNQNILRNQNQSNLGKKNCYFLGLVDWLEPPIPLLVSTDTAEIFVYGRIYFGKLEVSQIFKKEFKAFSLIEEPNLSA